VKLLKAKYGSKFFTHPEIEKDQLSQEYGTNDTRVTRELYDLLITKMERVLQQLKKLLVYADEDKLYPNYIMLGTATGRFQARQPELHNLSTSPPKTFVIKGERPEFYNVRDLLLSGDNVFSIDFANRKIG
jgi:hypothetical protein